MSWTDGSQIPGGGGGGGVGMAFRDHHHRRSPQLLPVAHYPGTILRTQSGSIKAAAHAHGTPGSHSPLHGSYSQLNGAGSRPQLYGSHPQLYSPSQMAPPGGVPPGVQNSVSRPQMTVGHAQSNGGHPQMNGSSVTSGGRVPTSSGGGGHPVVVVGGLQSPVNGLHPEVNGNHHQVNGGHPQVNGGHPQLNGGHHPPPTPESDQNRAVREAFRKERKIESYLADDLNFPTFAKKLKAVGLQLRDIPADGNCLFRALGDQLAGHCRNHYRHRQEIVQYMLDHRKDFEPFVEDDVPFDDHVNNLKKLGTHAGNDAIVAFARLHNVHVFIHQLRGDPLQIAGPSSSANVRQLHIAYHNGDHYSSIRRDGDNTESPANIRIPQENGRRVTPPAPPLSLSSTEDRGVVTAKRDLNHLEAEVIRATGCKDAAAVRESLKRHTYDVDATIASLLQSLELNGGGDDTTSLGSYQTTDSGIFAPNGPTGIISGGGASGRSSLKGKGQKVHFREDSFGGSSGYSSMGSNRGGATRPKLLIPSAPMQYQYIVTGRQAKELKKLEKKRKL